MKTRSQTGSVGQNALYLANIVRKHFDNRQVPSLNKLTILFERIFYASLKRDEARPARCSVAVLDPRRVGANTPDFLRFDHWQPVLFSPPIPMSAENLARLSQAVPATSGALAVWFANGQWMIWAAIDQEYVVRDFREHAGTRFYRRAGRFQVEIDDVGCLSVYHDSVLLAQQRRDRVIREFQDVIHSGVVAGLLDPYLDAHESAVTKALTNEPPSGDEDPVGVPINFIEHLLHRSRADWTAGLCRILLDIRQRGHGGALLLLPRMKSGGLKIGYRIDYRKLGAALCERGVARLFETCYEVYSPQGKRAGISKGLVNALNEARRRYEDARNAETGAVKFIGSLSGVDGLVALVGGLNVAGFGIEITTKREPPSVLRALDEQGNKTEPLDPQSLGTRHRSMIRYCFAHPNSIGFVVSQDGDVRAMVRVRDALLFWSNVALEGDAIDGYHIHCPYCSALSELVPSNNVGGA